MQVAQGFSLIGVLCFACSACSQSSSETDGNLSVIEQLVVNHLHNRNGTSTEIGIVYTPSTPAPENINCFVEVPTTTRVGGRCIQLGSIRGRSSRNSPWACQAGVHLAITQECQRSRARPRSGRRRGGSG
ncbi:hypothetical protein C0Q70_01315 [Pomacea canaliculata]|uniref:Uncharacterized protein n=1 Tax=Pomacea canaliculata TaxID=400727 RepID=A0A2T7PZ45_POMCA|nr:uncharacterized protein LOC112575067 [Pomacea canaliculata]XP_025112405.1 uncharacterized protein LOC112575067 [Pomacea canaliculata]PVD38695.1 hypothetical protein C0Q70_01315 [Pomacea canaliculata]